MDWSLTTVALALIAVAAVSKRLSGSPITPAMVFVAIGLIVGPKVLDEINIASTSSTERALAEATLALVLFSDASSIDLRALRRGASVPLRLLGIGLPLTIALGALAAAVIFGELTFWEAVIVGVILAPTDAALGQAVVTEPRVPTRIRQGLNVESGLNDGICVPLLFAAVAAADVQSGISGGRTGATLLFEEVGYGIVGGVVAALVVGAVVVYAGQRNLIDGAWRPVIPAAGAALAYGTASALHGSGFIAAFVAGMVFRAVINRDPGEMNRLTVEVGGVLSGVTFVIFGAILLGPALGELSWEACPLRGPQPDGRANGPRCDRDARLTRSTADAWVSRLVRSSRPGLDRLRGDRHRGLPASSRAPDRPRGLSHRGALGLRPWPHRRSLGRSLRGLVRAPPPKTGTAEVETSGRGDAPTRTARRRRRPARATRTDGSGRPSSPRGTRGRRSRARF